MARFVFVLGFSEIEREDAMSRYIAASHVQAFKPHITPARAGFTFSAVSAIVESRPQGFYFF